MEEGSGSSLWQRIGRIFGSKNDSVEQAIRDASEEGELDKEEGSMLLSILQLDNMQVQDIMTPRTDITCVADTTTISEVIEVIKTSGHSRIPIYKDNRDNFIGILHAKDIIPLMLKPDFLSTPAHSIMRTPYFIPETKQALDLLQEFKIRKQHLAITLDEYGGTSGLVSIEDVIEEIVGEIEDEHDTPRAEEIFLQDDGSYIIAGRTYLEDLHDALQLAITSDEVDTIGGYISLKTGRMPKSGEEFVFEGATFFIIEADAKQIHRIRITVPENSQPAND